MALVGNARLHLAIRLLLGGLFVWAGVGKIVGPLDFASSVYNYKLLPEFWVGVAAGVIPWLELLVGVALVTGVRIKGAALVTGLLMLLFISLLLTSWARGLNIDCGCFSGVERTPGLAAISEDAGMLLGSLFVLFLDRGQLSPAGVALRRLASAGKRNR
jgi:putative oxidoreductase